MELDRKILGFKRVLFHPDISPHLTFAFIPSRTVVAAPHKVILKESFSDFAVLQSMIHEIWARFNSSTSIELMRYTPTDCFETFPFPSGYDLNRTIEQIGRIYYEFRSELMIRNNEGLTKTYNRLHDPNEQSTDFVKFRNLHDQLDRAILDAYGWPDIQAKRQFLLDYEEDEHDELSPTTKRKPWHFRWTDSIRDEVLARLLDLNVKRAEEELLTISATLPEAKGRKNSPKRKIE